MSNLPPLASQGPTPSPKNGSPSPKSAGPVNRLDQQTAPAMIEEGQLFALFAGMARQAGREDLAREFLARTSPANGERTPAGAPAGDGAALAAAKAHHQNGLRLFKEGKLAEAEVEFRQAIRTAPNLADAHGNLGVTLARLGRMAEAEAGFRLAIRLEPTAAVMYTNLGTACLQQSKAAEAESWLRQGLLLAPQSGETHRLLGAALEARRQVAPAEAAYREALRCQPDLVEGHVSLGRLLHKQQKWQEAETHLRQAVRLQPKHTGALNSLGMALEAQDRPADAEASYREALRLVPNDVDVHNNLGVALAAQHRPEEAEACYREALRLRPKYAAALNNLGNTLRALDRLDEAAQSLNEALRLQPKYAEAHSNLGIVLVHQGQIDEGLARYDQALRLRPDYPDCRFNRSLALLSRADFSHGWPEYEWRWKGKLQKPPQLPKPRWDGSPLAGRTLLLLSEQGLGDAIQFIRYAALVRPAGATVLVDSPKVLAALLATCPGVDRVIPRGEGMPAFDLYIPLLSLPGMLGTHLENIPASIPYLKAEPQRMEYWRQQMAGIAGLRVGIVWQGSRQHRGDRQRSVQLSRFAGLATVPGVSLCSLQKGEGQDQLAEAESLGFKVHDLAKGIGPGFEDTAALVENLDLVIAVDTAVAHLAGALGKPVWVALPFAADWRWLRGRDDTPWYPSMRLFRQPARGDWEPVFQRMEEAVREVGIPGRAG